MSKSRPALVAILWVAFLVRLLWFVPFPDIPPEFDQSTFLHESRALATRGLLQWTYDERAPGYFLYLAAHAPSDTVAARAAIRVTQSLLGVATVAAIFVLTRLLFAGTARVRRERIGLIAAALMALYPDYVFYTQLLWSETFFIFLTAFAFVFLLRAYRAHTMRRWYLASGLYFGAALLTREVLLAFVVVLIPLWLWLALPSGRRARAQMILIFAVGVAALLVPWTARNMAQGNGVELISWQGGRDFWKYNARFLKTGIKRKAMATVLGREPNGAAKNARGYREGLALIMDNPGDWFLKKAYNTAQLWRSPNSVALDTARHLGLVTRAAQKQFAPYFNAIGMLWIIFTVIGFVYYPDARIKLLFALFVLAALAAFFAIHYIGRFWLGLAAPLFSLTAYGLYATVVGVNTVFKTRRIADAWRLGLTLFLLFLLGATFPGAQLGPR